jgi:ABC-type phosphate/phosphonate transport system substrate-binding protein
MSTGPASSSPVTANTKPSKTWLAPRWAYPDAGSTSGYLYPASIFADMGVEIGETLEAGGHPQSIFAVYNGQADVATAFFSAPLLPEGRWAMGDSPEVPGDVSGFMRAERRW